MCPANPSISEVGVEATKKQTKTELKIQKKNRLFMFQEKERLYTTHSSGRHEVLSRDKLNGRGSRALN